MSVTWDFFADQINPDRVKEVLTKPVVVGHSIHRMKSGSRSASIHQSETTGESAGLASGFSDSHSFSHGRGTASVETNTEGSVHSEMAAAGFSHIDGSGPIDGMATHGATTIHTNEGTGHTEAKSSSNSFSESEFEGYAHSSSNSRVASRARSRATARSRGATEQEGFSETLVPILQNRASATYSLEEQAHVFATGFMKLPKRFAYLKRSGQKAVLIKSLDTPDPIVSIQKTNRVISEMKSACPYLTTAAEADAEIELRRRQVEELAHGVIITPVSEPDFID